MAKAQRTVARRKRLNRPFTGELRTWRRRTKRSRLIKLLRKGATIAKCQRTLDWTYKDCYDNIVLLHSFTGFGLEEDERGVIRLIEEE